jgi:hypothetical protein
MTKAQNESLVKWPCAATEGLIPDLKANIYMKDPARSVCDNIVHKTLIHYIVGIGTDIQCAQPLRPFRLFRDFQIPAVSQYACSATFL